jgi:hypothetical protein
VEAGEQEKAVCVNFMLKKSLVNILKQRHS